MLFAVGRGLRHRAVASSSGCCGRGSWARTARRSASRSPSRASSSSSRRSSSRSTSTAGSGCAPWPHFWTGVPVVLSGIGGTSSVVAANGWMNQPAGFTVRDGRVVDVDPLGVFFNDAFWYEALHMLLAAYMVAGFVVAGVYAVGMLRGRQDRYHRLGLADPAHRRRDRHAAADLRRRRRRARGRAAASRPSSPRSRRCPRPARTSPEVLGGAMVDGEVRYAHRDPVGRLAARRATARTPGSQGLDADPGRRPAAGPPRRRRCTWRSTSWSASASRCSGSPLWFAVALVAAARPAAEPAGSCARSRSAASLAVVALEAGWIVTEVGRQPWTVVGLLLTRDAVTTTGQRVAVLRRDRRRSTPRSASAPFYVLRLLRRRWRTRGRRRGRRRRTARPVPGRRRRGGHGMSTFAAVVLFIGVVAYAVLGGADYGAGFWDLTAGGAERGARAAAPDRPVARPRCGRPTTSG